MKEQYDSREGYCKMLGHFLTFEYCRTSNKGIPCSKVLDCWFESFDVQHWLGENFSATEQRSIFQAVKPKIVSLAEILEQAQQRLKKEE